MTPTRAICALTVALAALARPVAAQQPEADRWQFDRLQFGFCIEFLVDSAHARKLLPDEALPLRADAVAGLGAALRSVVEGQPEYRSWMPASLCLYRFGTLDVAGRQLGGKAPKEDKDADREGEALGFLLLAARAPSAGSGDADLGRKLFTTSWRASKLAEGGQVQLETIRASFGKAPKGTDDRYTIRLGRTTLLWDGHPTRDSTAGGAVERKWTALSREGHQLRFTWTLQAQVTRGLVGALVVQGKDDLAKALQASPIRFVGEFVQGGSGQLEIARQP